MKDSRIMLALKKKLSDKRNEAKIKRIKKTIEAGILNAEEQRVIAEDKLDSVIQGIDADTNVQTLIRTVSQLLTEKDEAKEAVDQLNRVSEYLFEELDVPDEEE